MKKLATPKLFWAGWVAVGTYWEWRSLHTHDGATFSETTRCVLFTHTLPGKAAFLTGCAALLWWFPRHILLTAVEGSIEFLTPNEDNDNAA